MTPALHIRRPPNNLPPQAGLTSQLGRPSQHRTSQDRARPQAAHGLAWWMAPIVLAAALVALGSAIGLWYLPFAAGLLLGVATRLGRPGGPGFASGAAGVLLLGPAAWGVVLAAMSGQGAAIGATARIAAASAGLPPFAALTVALTLLIALLQTAAGLWLGRALTPRRDWRSHREIKGAEDFNMS